MVTNRKRDAILPKGIIATPVPSQIRPFHGQIPRQRRAARLPRLARHAAALGAARISRSHRHQVWLRPGAMRRLHGAHRRRAGARVRDTGLDARGQAGGHHRGRDRHFAGARRARRAGRVDRQGCRAVRLLPVGASDGRGRAARQECIAHRCADRRGHERQHLPLRHLPARARGDQERRRVAQGHGQRSCSEGCSEGRAQARSEEGLTMTTVNRRQFLKSSATLGGALVIGFWLPGRGGRAFAQPQVQRSAPPNAFLRIGKDGTCTVFVKHLEFGQGVTTSLPMLVAEELGCDWTRVRAQLADAEAVYAHTAFGMQMTGGSSSVSNSWDQLRTVGAQARTMLMQAAADQWKVKPADVRVENGFVVGPGGKRLSYGQLAEAAGKLPVPEKVELKPAKDFKLIGKPTRRLDSADKVSGKATFGLDLKRKDLHTALIARPPVFGGKVKSFNADKVKLVPGVTHVVETPNWVAVVGRSFWAAKQGRDALQVEWDLGPNAGLSTEALGKQFRELAKTPGRSAKKAADPAAIKAAAKSVVAEYEVPYLAHAPMEPLNCTVEIQGDGAEIWVGSQFQGVDQPAAAKALGLDASKVKLHTMLAGGGFGRRANPASDYVLEACEVAKKVKVPDRKSARLNSSHLVTSYA